MSNADPLICQFTFNKCIGHRYIVLCIRGQRYMWQAKRPCLLCRLLSFPTSNCGSRSTLLLFPEWRHSLMKLLSYYAPYETGCAVTLETIPALNTFKRCFTTCHLPFVASLHFSTLGIICLSLSAFFTVSPFTSSVWKKGSCIRIRRSSINQG